MSDELDLIIRRKMLELQKRELMKVVEERCEEGVRDVNEFEFMRILKRCKIVLADFWAEWCGPCKMIEPIIEEIAAKYTPKIAVVRINVGENPKLTSRYQVMSIPTLILYKRGKEFKRIIGFYPQLINELEREIKNMLNN